MKFHMVSSCGEGGSLLHDIQQEGNDVQIYIKEAYYRRCWDGILPKAKSIKPPDGAVVIFDFSGMGSLADELRKAGFATVGGSKFADKLEQDRMFGLNTMEEVGIKVPFTLEFEGFDLKDIEEFVEEHGKGDKRFVYKPSGKNLPASLTYCAKDSEDLMRWCEYVEQNYKNDVDSFVLQEFIEGVCISSEGWCDGKKFVKPYNHTLETKKFMNDELGSSTGCSGNIVWAERDESCRILREGLSKMEKLTAENGHVGPMDLNAVVNQDGVFGLEWTPRFGYTSMPTTVKMIEGGVGKFFSDLARGQAKEMRLTDKLGSGVKLSIPPYPIEPMRARDSQLVTPNYGIPIRGIPEGKEANFYWYEIESDGKDGLVHSAGTGVIADIIGLGDTVEEAFKEPYQILEELQVPNAQYRTDLPKIIGKMYEEAKDQEKSSK